MTYNPLADYRITTGWRLSGTKNFRLASSKLLGFYGINAQNPSDSLMACIIPPKNYILIQGDQEGAEARVVAWECRRARLRKLFELGINPHCYTGLQLSTKEFAGEHPISRYFKVEPEVLITYPEYKELFARIKSSKRYRFFKIVRHARNYKMGPRNLQLTTLEQTEGAIVLTYSQAQDFLATDEEVFPEISELQNEIKNTLLATRTLRNLFGFPRQFTSIWSESLVRDGCAFIPQSTVGTITNLAYVEMHNKIIRESLSWVLLNNKHDSILLAVPDNDRSKEDAIQSIRQSLGRTLTSTRGETYTMGVGISVGYNWAHYDEKDNPKGMKEI